MTTTDSGNPSRFPETRGSAAPFHLSVAIPVLNERAVLPELLARLTAVLDSTPGGPHQIVLVDDGSTDGSRALLSAAARRDPRIIAVFLSRNFGHQAALTAALDHVEGDATVVMDADLQDPPECIPDLLARHRAGYDVVYARRVGRKESRLLRWCYWLYYRIVNRLAEIPLPLDSGDFALLSARVVKALREMPERQRYLRGLRTWAGFRQTSIPVERDARFAGRSKYSPARLVQLALDGIFSFSVLPIRLGGLLGGVAVVGAAGYAVYATAVKLINDQSPQGFTAIIVLLVFLSGVHLLFLGVIGEYVGRLYHEAKARPVYLVDKIVGGQSTTATSATCKREGAEPTGTASARASRSGEP